MNAISTRISENGRITVPARMRAAAGLECGAEVVLELVDGEVHLRSLARTMDRAREKSRALLAGKKNVGVDDFLADRRAGAARE
ncbi:MAG TPA: AbrB/MazE/SpoVT family DNA-binding domain-containing protein [Caulobacteraceae bacterium]